MTIGEALVAFGEKLASLWPLRIVPDWQQGVFTRAGNIRKTCTSTNGLFGTGAHLLIPLVDAIDLQDTNAEAICTECQTLTTGCGTTVMVGLTMRYSIEDLGTLYRQVHDQDETIDNVLAALVGQWVPNLTWEGEEGEDDEYAEPLTTSLVKVMERELTERFESWGIEVEDVSAHTLARVRSYRLFTS